MKKYFELSGFLLEKSSYRKLHRNTKSIKFLEECIRNGVIPKNSQLGKSEARFKTPKEKENSEKNAYDIDYRIKELYS